MQRRLLRSASFRLTLLYAVVFSLSVMVLAVLMFFSIRNSLQLQLRHHIESDTEQLLGDYRQDGLNELRHDVRERSEETVADRLYYAVQRPDGRAILDNLPRIERAGWHRLVTRNGTRLLVKATRLSDDHMLLVAGDLTRIQAVETLMRTRFLLALAITVLVGLMGGLWASKRFLNRIDMLARTTERIGEGHLSERIMLSGSNDEFDQLATAINRMLGRIEALVQNLKHVSTSIAHDLRTPLGRLRQKLEAMGESKQVEEALELMDETLATFSALLRIAEIESGSRRAGFTPVALSALVQRLADTYTPLAEENEQHIQTNIAPHVQVTGDESLLTQLVVNLLENAMLHAGSGCRITLILTADAKLAVTDTGPGISEADRAEALKPFFRLDQSRHSKGNGLGLTLAHAIAQLHGAKLTLADNAPGLRVNVEGFAKSA